MLNLESLQADHFAPLMSSSFSVEGGATNATLELIEVRKLGHKRSHASRDPFALTFRGQPGWRLPQGIYSFNHAALGTLEIFITQVGYDAQGSTFEAVFT